MLNELEGVEQADPNQNLQFQMSLEISIFYFGNSLGVYLSTE